MLTVMQTVLIIFGLAYNIMTLHIFPVYVHFDLKFFNNFKHAMLIGLYSPLSTIGMILGLVIINFLFSKIPGLIPAIGISLSAAIIMACALFAFHSIDKKQQNSVEDTEVDSYI